MDKCKPLPCLCATAAAAAAAATWRSVASVNAAAASQGLTLVHFSAQRKRFL